MSMSALLREDRKAASAVATLDLLVTCKPQLAEGLLRLLPRHWLTVKPQTVREAAPMHSV